MLIMFRGLLTKAETIDIDDGYSNADALELTTKYDARLAALFVGFLLPKRE